MRRGICAGICTAVAMCAALSVPSSATPRDVTVGVFVVQLASLREPKVLDFVSARARLEADGVTLPALDPGKTLTQADVVAIGNAAGLHLMTSSPSAPFGKPGVDSFLATFRYQLQGGGRSGSGSQSSRGGNNQGGNGQGGNGQGQQKSRSNPQ